MEVLTQDSYQKIEIDEYKDTIQLTQKNLAGCKEVIVIDKKHLIDFIGLLIKEYSTLNQQK